jgi:hypothetical protein
VAGVPEMPRAGMPCADHERTLRGRGRGGSEFLPLYMLAQRPHFFSQGEVGRKILCLGTTAVAMSNCRSHCRTCHTHFSSDAAFDAHRRGPAEGRYCCDTVDDGRFAIKAQTGKCAICVRPSSGRREELDPRVASGPPRPLEGVPLSAEDPRWREGRVSAPVRARCQRWS